MVIKDKKRFVKSVGIVISIALILVLFMSHKTFSHQELKYKTVSVISGDTLWEIAKSEQKNNSYYKDNDIRDIIDDIKQVNNLKNSDLKTNQMLEIPTYE